MIVGVVVFVVFAVVVFAVVSAAVVGIALIVAAVATAAAAATCFFFSCFFFFYCPSSCSYNDQWLYCDCSGCVDSLDIDISVVVTMVGCCFFTSLVGW